MREFLDQESNFESSQSNAPLVFGLKQILISLNIFLDFHIVVNISLNYTSDRYKVMAYSWNKFIHGT